MGAVLGYCFLEDGRLSDGVALRSMEESAPICTDAEKIPVPDQNL